MYYNITAGDLPEVLKLQKIRGADGLNVFDTVGANDYKTFGMLLLEDNNGQKVNLKQISERWRPRLGSYATG